MREDFNLHIIIIFQIETQILLQLQDQEHMLDMFLIGINQFIYLMLFQ